jgi:hypothetical protein
MPAKVQDIERYISRGLLPPTQPCHLHSSAPTPQARPLATAGAGAHSRRGPRSETQGRFVAVAETQAASPSHESQRDAGPTQGQPLA